MLRHSLLSPRILWGFVISVFCIVGAMLYLKYVEIRPQHEIQQTSDIVKPLNESTTQTTSSPEANTNQKTPSDIAGAHVHEPDGDWLAESHPDFSETQGTPPVPTHGDPTPETRHPVELKLSDAQKQRIVYQQRYAQYINDYNQWREKIDGATAHTYQIRKKRDNIAPREPEEFVEFVRSLSDTERKEVAAKFKALIDEFNTAVEKENEIWQQKPVRPTPPQSNE